MSPGRYLRNRHALYERHIFHVTVSGHLPVAGVDREIALGRDIYIISDHHAAWTDDGVLSVSVYSFYIGFLAFNNFLQVIDLDLFSLLCIFKLVISAF